MNQTQLDWKYLHHFWLGDLQVSEAYLKNFGQLWFQKSNATDEKIKRIFSSYLKHVDQEGLISRWLNTGSASAWLSHIILLDQFPRNMFRNHPKSYAYDAQALDLCLQGLDKKMDLQLHPIERLFFYLPLEHSESLEMQNLSLEKFKALEHKTKNDPFHSTFKNFSVYAKQHYDIVNQYGRFPHRNVILNRPSTHEEMAFLKKPGSSF